MHITNPRSNLSPQSKCAVTNIAKYGDSKHCNYDERKRGLGEHHCAIVNPYISARYQW